MVNIVTGSSSGDKVQSTDKYDMLGSSSDAEKIAIIDNIFSYLEQADKRIEENQKAIDISKIETRIILELLKGTN
jgi:hypothetical protein